MIPIFQIFATFRRLLEQRGVSTFIQREVPKGSPVGAGWMPDAVSATWITLALPLTSDPTLMAYYSNKHQVTKCLRVYLALRQQGKWREKRGKESEQEREGVCKNNLYPLCMK